MKKLLIAAGVVFSILLITTAISVVVILTVPDAREFVSDLINRGEPTPAAETAEASAGVINAVDELEKAEQAYQKALKRVENAETAVTRAQKELFNANQNLAEKEQLLQEAREAVAAEGTELGKIDPTPRPPATPWPTPTPTPQP